MSRPPGVRLSRWALAAGLVLASCAPEAAPVRSGWSVDPSPLVTIASGDSSGEAVFVYPTGAARLSNGEIAVSDGSATVPAIVFFDAQGRKVRTVGRSGSGPGEYRTIAWMAQCGPDTLYAYDLWLRRITVMGGSGDFVRQFRLPVGWIPGCSGSGALAVLGAYERRVGSSPSLRSATSPLSLHDSRGSAPRVLGEVPVWDLAYTDFGGWVLRLAGRIPSVAASSDRVYVGPSDSSSVIVFAMDGRRLASLPIQVEPRAPARRHLESAAEYMVSFAPPGALRDRMRQRFLGVAPAEHLPPFSTLTVDPDGVLWANLSVPGDTTAVLRALDESGRVLGEVRIPVGLKVFEIGRDYVLGTYDDADGAPVVALYRLRKGS